MSKRSVKFEAEIPDFLKILQGIPVQSTIADKQMNDAFKLDEGNVDREDDKPMIANLDEFNEIHKSNVKNLGDKVEPITGTEATKDKPKKSNILLANKSKRDVKRQKGDGKVAKKQVKKLKEKKSLLSFDQV
jgi:hypothetical protein